MGAPGTNIYSTVANSSVSIETFEGVLTPGIPAGWVTGGNSPNWLTYNRGGDWGKVLYADVSYPYTSNASTSITSPTNPLSGSGATVDFWTGCDTEYDEVAWVDYMSLEVSGDGIDFTEVERWDEASLDTENGAPADGTGFATYHFRDIFISSEYITANFKYRFRWVTNGSNNNYDGCYVDDVEISTLSDGSDERYGYADGTSMAAPHVAGLAALIEGYNPTLTAAEVKNIVLTSGDALVSLSTTTVSGKRINAHKALQAAVPEKAIAAFNFSSPNTVGVVNESAKTVLLGVPIGTVVTALTPTITTSRGASVSPASLVVHDFTASSTYTVTALDGTTQAYEVGVVFVLSSSKDISSFGFPGATGVISGTNISVTVPYGTSVTALIPTIAISGASVSPATGVAQNFSSPVSYTVTADDASTQVYIVTVTVLSGGGGGGGGGGGSSSSKKKTTSVPVVATTSVAVALPSSTSTVALVAPQITGYVFSKDFGMGAQGIDVTELQKRLTKEGTYTGTVSGYFGPLTFAAVQAYQKKMGITADGYVGALTREKLNTQNTAIQALIASLKAQLLILIQQLEELRRQEQV